MEGSLSLQEALQEAVPRARLNALQRIAKQLSPEDRDTLQGVLLAPGVNARQITDALARMGHRISVRQMRELRSTYKAGLWAL